MIQNKKASILLILKVLEEYSDEEHFLTQQEIIDKVNQIYGIELERKSVAFSLTLLEELNYDIVKSPKRGFALLSRTFDETEAFYLIDAVFSSRSIDGKQAKKITESISSCFSKYQRKDYSYLQKSTEINRTSNKQVMYSISIIHEAIKKGKRVGFQYLSFDKDGKQIVRREGYQFIVSPYYLINNFGRYYLLCNYREKYRAIQTFRVDYMLNIEIKNDWPIKKMDELEDSPKNFSISKYINEHLYMLGDETIEAELELDDESSVLYIKDWFGESAKLRTKDGKTYANIKCNETSLYYWIMQYSDCVKAISPSSFVERIKKGLEKAIRKYGQ